MQSTPDTIVALATPAGRGGVGIVRVSGAKVGAIGQKMLKQALTPRLAQHSHFYDPIDNQVIDLGIALYFKGPHSFTGEDVLEFQGHGGPVILDRLINGIVSLGARLARPGEFTERAFLNGKLDLTQAEAVADLIDSTTVEAASSALKSLQGAFSTAITEINQQVIHIRVWTEAALDFPDEALDTWQIQQLLAQLRQVIYALQQLLGQAQQGCLLREGKTAVIVGVPNAGKSSLLNILAGEARAIVTEVPGTTRDVLSAQLNIEGVPLHILDTAGLRAATDIVEQEGVKRAEQALVQADYILYVQDVHDTVPDPYIVAKLSPYQEKVIKIFNKIDLTEHSPGVHHNAVYISAKQGLGIAPLQKHLLQCMNHTTFSEGQFMARRRHLVALERALAYCQEGERQLNSYHAAELLAEELRMASQALGEITGEFTTEDLLGRIFSSFCIGK
jgi:tRNA modification GTPase